MEHREKTGTKDCENRHGFSRAVDGCSPPLPQNEQEDRESRSGMPDPDPPDEIDDIPAPADVVIQPPDTDTSSNQHIHAPQADQCHRNTDENADVPPPGGPVGFKRPQDLMGDLPLGLIAVYKFASDFCFIHSVRVFLVP